MVGGRHMRMCADDEAGAPIDEMPKALLLAGRLGMKVEHDRVRLFLQRAGSQNGLGRLEGIIEFGMHEHATHDVGHKDARTVAGKIEAGAAPGRACGRVGGP